MKHYYGLCVPEDKMRTKKYQWDMGWWVYTLDTVTQSDTEYTVTQFYTAADPVKSWLTGGTLEMKTQMYTNTYTQMYFLQQSNHGS